MKGKLFFVFLLLMLPIANATLDLTSIKGYINDIKVDDIDKGGGDFYVHRDETIKLTVTLDNTENTTTRAKLVGKINNIKDDDDIEVTQDWFSISSGDDKSKTILFTIPSNAAYEEFDMELNIYYNYSNDTGSNLNKVSFNVIVEKGTPVDEETTVYGLLVNLTNNCGYLAKSADTCFGYMGRYGNCTEELSTVKEERGDYKNKYEDSTGTLGICNSDKATLEESKADLNNQISQLQTEKDSMLTYFQCNNQTASAVERTRAEEKGKSNQLMMFIALGVGLWYVMDKKKKAKFSSATAYQSSYFEKRF